MCGIVGIYNYNGPNIVKALAASLLGNQIRGQEGAGIAISDGGRPEIYREFGYAGNVFNKPEVVRLVSDPQLLSWQKHAMGGLRYSTTGGTDINNIHPVSVDGFYLIHNGNLVNTEELRKRYDRRYGGKYHIKGTTDSELMAAIFADAGEITRGAERCMEEAKGGFSLIVMDEQGKMALIRDRRGFWPLHYARSNGTFYASSESIALNTMGLHDKDIMDLERGKALILSPDGEERFNFSNGEESRFCYFNSIYFARTGSRLFGKTNKVIRKDLGKLHARHDSEEGIKLDLVIPVLMSGLDGGIGYHEESGVPFDTDLDTNSFIGRIYMTPQGKEEKAYRRLFSREELTLIKHVPLESEVKGKKIGLTDDSIIRKNACKTLVRLLFSAGAAEVHVRIASPPTLYPCYYGQDFPTREELGAARISESIGTEDTRRIGDEMAREVGATSLRYSTIEDLRSVTGDGICTACLDGNYDPQLPNEPRFEVALSALTRRSLATPS